MLSARVPDRRVGKTPQVSHPASPSYTDPGPQKPQKLGIGVAKKKKTRSSAQQTSYQWGSVGSLQVVH